MSHPSIHSETSRPVSDAALCVFALLTPVASAPAFVFSPNICRVCDCPHGRFEIKAKKPERSFSIGPVGLAGTVACLPSL